MHPMVLRRLHRLLPFQEPVSWLTIPRLRLHWRPEFRYRHDLCPNRQYSRTRARHAKPDDVWCHHSGRRICICFLRYAGMAPLSDTGWIGRPGRRLHLHSQCSSVVTVVVEEANFGQRYQFSGLRCRRNNVLACDGPDDSQHRAWVVSANSRIRCICYQHCSDAIDS